MDLIRQIEEVSMNSWPSLQTIHYDGWVLRFAEGLTRRSNSVYPIYDSKTDVDSKIIYCEYLYKLKELPVCFKITEIAQPYDLDKILDSKGYDHEFDISVQLRNIDEFIVDQDRNAHITEYTEVKWIDYYIQMNEMNPIQKPILKKIIDQIILPKCLLTYYLERFPIGCGLGVIDDKFLGLFDIVIDKQFRNKGFGKSMIDIILMWGKNNGAKVAYLQVLTDNNAAIRLYDKVGFKEAYRYWYRIKKYKH
jgi:N-acetylglutamate synthase